jgi:hypothetical protein
VLFRSRMKGLSGHAISFFAGLIPRMRYYLVVFRMQHLQREH